MQDNYDTIFEQGFKDVKVTNEMLPLSINENAIRQQINKAASENKWVLAFIIGTKPCFYKFYGSIINARKQDIPYIVINANQHYDDNLTYGIKEFGIDVAINLNIRGGLLQKSIELLTKFNHLSNYFGTINKNVKIVPVVLGDTILTSIVPAAWMFARNEKAIQNEAGLRGMTPSILKTKPDIKTFYDKQASDKWIIMRNEPFPEQWDTYVSAAGCEYHFCPTELNKEHLIREGYPEENIFVTGGVVVEALDLKLKEKPKTSIFDTYPQLKNGEWIRMDIHRRENLTPSRFKAIIGGIKELVNAGYNINFIEMNATKYALEQYGLRNEFEKLKNKKNFLATDVWPEYANVIEFYKSKNCMTAFTDSGGVQEEMNLLKKPCLTCRFNTDRPETVNQAKTNLLVPAISKEFILDSINHLTKTGKIEELTKGKQIYGSNVAEKFTSKIKELMNKNARLFTWAHQALGYNDEETKSGFL